MIIIERWHRLKAKTKKRWAAIFITSSVVVLIFILQYMGGLKFFELMMLDYWFRLRPVEVTDTRITIVTISESDISQIEQWPFPDAVLAKAIDNIKRQKPRAIGLDIYRDLPVEPGHQNLQQVFASTPNLIGIKKVVGKNAGLGVAPPPILSEEGRVTATDIVMDPDGKLRRNLLSLKDREGKTVLALGTKLALLYLERENITPQIIDRQKQTLKLGKETFKPLQSQDGGYIDIELGGYQILANFRHFASSFPTLSFSQVLADNISPNSIEDRVVLIGLKADSFQDRFYTPYSTSLGTTLAGVEIHADLTSQIIAAALDGRKAFRFWAEPVEWLWIVFWSAIGTILAWFSGSPKWLLCYIAIAITLLTASTYLLFLDCYWVIFVSPLLGLLGSAIGNFCYGLWIDLKHSYAKLANYAQTLESEVAIRTEELQKKIRDRRIAQAKLQESLAEKELLLKEVYHRVKNNLQVVSSLFSLQSQYTRDPQVLGILAESQNRLQSMALVHQQLYQSEQLGCVDFTKYLGILIDRLFDCYQIDRQRIERNLRVDSVILNLDNAILCGLIANELISNSLKHGFPHGRMGAIEVRLRDLSPQHIVLSVSDNGIGLPANFDIQHTNTLGLRLVRVLTRQLKGKLEIDAKYDSQTTSRGVRWQIIFPQPNHN